MGTLRNLLTSLIQIIQGFICYLRSDYVRLQLNEQELLKKFKYAYTESTTVLGELMQNARRAGATCVRFDLQDDGHLCISDDGCGIGDMQILFRKAESGWTQAIVDEETPYGLGYLAAIFASDTLLVQSNGRRLECRTEDLIQQAWIRVTSANTSIGTYMELQLNISLGEIERALRRRATGFPIAVFLNGNELPRPHALGQGLPFQEAEFGQVYITDLARAANMGNKDVLGDIFCALYLQGLPVTRERHLCLAGNVVHLDSKRYAARLPDRDCLVDHDLNERLVLRAIPQFWRSRLEAIKPRLSSETFANRYFGTLKLWGALDLLDDVPVLPNCVLFEVVGTPVQTKQWEEEPSFVAPYQGEAITRTSVEAGKAIVELDKIPRPDSLPGWLYAHKAKTPCIIKSSLSPTHWVQQYAISLDANVDVAPVGAIVEDKYRGDSVQVNVRRCDRIEMDGPLGVVSVDDTCLYCESRGGNAEILIPALAINGEDICQVSSFEDEYDAWNKTDEDNEVDRFRNYLRAFHTGSGSQVLDSILRQIRLGDFRSLLGRSFVVTVCPDGEPSVVEHS